MIQNFLQTFLYFMVSLLIGGAEYGYAIDDQVLWGTWTITAKMYGGGMGWQSCQDEYQGIEFGFTPDSFYYDGETVEVAVYEAEVLAVSEEYTFHGWGYDRLGVNGDYLIDLEFKEDICPFFFTVISDKEMLLTVGRLMYKAEKVENAEYNCETAFIVCPYFDLCYGEWEIVQKVNMFDNFYQNIHIGEIVEIGHEWKGRGNGYDMYIKRTNPKIEMEEEIHQGFSHNEESEDYYRPFITFNIMGWNDRQNALLEKSDNSFIVCYNLPEDFYWDKILARDDMTVYFIKNSECYMAKRISDPVGIYTIKNESTLKMKDLKPENLLVLDEKLLSEEEQNSYSSNVTLGEPVLFNNFSDYERYFVYRNEEFIKNVYTYKSDNINITLEQALDLCAEVLEREDPDLVMQRTMKEEKEGYVGYTFNYREFGDKNWLQIIENKIGTLGVEPYDGIQYEVYMYEDIVDDIETGEGHTAITATFHIFLRDKLLVVEM